MGEAGRRPGYVAAIPFLAELANHMRRGQVHPCLSCVSDDGLCRCLCLRPDDLLRRLSAEDAPSHLGGVGEKSFDHHRRANSGVISLKVMSHVVDSLLSLYVGVPKCRSGNIIHIYMSGLTRQS